MAADLESSLGLLLGRHIIPSTAQMGVSEESLVPPSPHHPGMAPANHVPNPRNAGRKKSNPVWEFFTDLRAYGLAGVRCRFCHWLTNDRSPTTMKFHLKRKHDTGPGGLWALCEEKIGQQAPPAYSRKRPSNENGDMLRRTVMQNVMSNVHEQMLSTLLQQAAAIPSPKQVHEGLKRHCPTDRHQGINRGIIEELASFLSAAVNNNGIENGAINGSHAFFMPKIEESELAEESFSSPSGPTPFSLSDGIPELLQIANESELVFTFNSRRNGEFCYESADPRKKGHLVTFADGVSELLVTHCIDGEEKTRECWKKSDWAQFQWAVRGALSHFLKN